MMQRNVINTLPQLKRKRIKKREQIGRGSYAIVYKGLFNHQTVAIKEAIPTKKGSIKSIKDEINMIEHLQPQTAEEQPSAEYIIHFHGYFEKINKRYPYKTKEIFIVMEYADKLNLTTWIDITDQSIIHKASLQIASGLAVGLSYIHHKDIIHCDLKADNILIFTNHLHQIHAKIGDFGLARFSNDQRDACGSALYFAPELLLDLSGNTTASDVYALALVYWELYAQNSLQNSYQDIDTISELIEEVAVNQERPVIPATCPQKVADLMKWCWQQAPADRPNAKQMSDTLSEQSTMVASDCKKPSARTA